MSLFTSVLKRAIDTADHLLRPAGDAKTCPPSAIRRSMSVHYVRPSQGLDKAGNRPQNSARRSQLWRRRYDVQPPAARKLKDTRRPHTALFLYRNFLPIKANQNVLISAHGITASGGYLMNSDNLSEQEILELNIRTAFPLSTIATPDRQTQPTKSNSDSIPHSNKKSPAIPN